MKTIKVRGKKRLGGCLQVQGAKNSVLPILAATLLINGRSVIHNCPDLTDVDAALKILIMLGCVCVRDETTVIVDASDAANYEISKELMSEMRSSVVFLGAVISRMGKAVISYPGGCELGPRPIDLHLSALKKMGVSVNDADDRLICSASGGIRGAEIFLTFPSVGATENIIIAACLSKGTTVIKNAAKEPEISDLCDFLNKAGAKIKGAGSSTVIIEGVNKLHSVEHRVLPDRIVAATYLSAAAVTNGEICLKNTGAANMLSIIRFFDDMGCNIKTNGKEIYLKGKEKYSACLDITTGVYPAFPTDAGPVTLPLFLKSDGSNSITETIFKNRFRYIDQLNKFNADITLDGNTAISNGIKELIGANVECTDLRGGAALILAALMAEGESVIYKTYHIERGYCNIVNCFAELGADIKEL
ncbi:MAG: UDP-N-acetylglucosamine 1-carboxyvinyltransferase [Ruminococcaceae bacterium]|nr:UDP-N-acetylglucosamine 1-carboxyvinyltransferase [Oscillospiraceae bacterium]